MEEAVKSWEAEGGWRFLHKHIRHCKVSNMFHGEDKRLEISVPLLMHVDPAMDQIQFMNPSWAWALIVAEMRKRKMATPMEGIAPPGNFERLIQEYIDTMEGKPKK